MKKEAEKKNTEKKNNEKTGKKKALVTVCSIVAFLAVVAGAFFITKAIDGKTAVSITEFLVSGHEWEKVGEETVVWTFENEKACKVTTNSTETFDCEWEIEGDTLKIRTKWLRELEDEFTLEINEAEKSFKIISKEDGKESTFVQKSKK